MPQFRPFHRVLLALAFLASLTSAARAVDPRLLPADTEMVITINVKQALSDKAFDSMQNVLKSAGGNLVQQATVAQVRKLVQDRMPGYERAMLLLDKADFELTRDIHSITLAHPGSVDVHNWFVIVEGRFAPDKFAAALKKFAEDRGQRMKIFQVDKTPVVRIKLEKKIGKNEAVWLSLIDGKSLVLSYHEDAVKDAIRRVRANRIEAKQIEKLLRIANDKQTLSFLMTPEGIQRIVKEAEAEKRNFKLEGTYADKLAAMLDGIRMLFARYGKGLSASGAITLAADFQFEFHVGHPKREEAKVLVEAFQPLPNLIPAAARAQAESQKDDRWLAVAALADSMRATQRPENFAVLTGSVSYANLAKLLSLMASPK